MKASYEKINYNIRAAKCIERKMLCESFRRLSVFGKIESYNYVGFGSTYFSDFSFFHKSLDIRNMISIEKDENNKDRFEFNRPFRCIKMEYGSSNEILQKLNWDARTILWLDYDGRLNQEVLLDINSFCTKVTPGSLIIISVNAEPGKELGTRFQKLRDAVGHKKIPEGTREKDLLKWGTAKVFRAIIYNEIMQILNGRNGVRSQGNKLCYRQLFNFNYSDGAKMLTTGGIIYDEGQRPLFDRCSFRDLLYIREEDEAYHIEIPNLTFKEIRYLDEQLPRKQGQTLTISGVRQADINKYEKVYRYFPAFTEANL
ncbi:MAG: hypothetical protein HWN68_00660 [Desulfobacterales bacterium]|nr:hypothetical protein [Desulfobacterales bacterium]